MKENHAGYVVGNSVISSEVFVGGGLYDIVRYNPPYFTEGENCIRTVGGIVPEIEIDGRTIPFGDISFEPIENTYPLFSASLSIADGISADFETFAPITPGKSDDMFIPYILMSFTFHTAVPHEVSLGMKFYKYSTDKHDDHVFMRIGDSMGTDEAETRFTASDGVRITGLFGIFDGRSPWRDRFSDDEQFSDYVLARYGELKDGIMRFIREVPDFGGRLHEYARWYSQAAVMLTKADCGGNVITMGYHELNQRDSFWTTFMHLFLFPDLERRMIEISAENQRDDGKIPTTLLPLIERDCDIDINEYFCLRIARYYEYYRDKDFLERFFGSYKRSVGFILSRDRDGDMLPEQDPPSNPECFWGDWKDVGYVSGRMLSPHFCLLWLAVLKYGAFLAREIGDAVTADEYDRIYESAYRKINGEWDGTKDGGMFAGDHYAEIWYDGEKRDHVLEDQTVGIFFGVVPPERIGLIYSALKGNECKYGIRETFPYREGVSDRGGIYHNGGIWPWLVFCDLAGRYMNGRRDEALLIAERLGYYDLEKPGNYRPNEYLNGNTGENCGSEVQGWSSAIWALEYVRRANRI